MNNETNIQTETVVLEPGTSQQITVRATNVQMINFRAIRDPDPPPERDIGRILDILDLDEVTITPRPPAAKESYPPYWMWKRLEPEVEITFPIRVGADIPLGTYRSPVRGWRSTDHNDDPADMNDIVITVRSTNS